MSWIHTQADFEGGAYSSYQRYPFFPERGEKLEPGWSQFKNQRVLIAGCGYGYLVEELASRGFTLVWGFDASPYAVQVRAPEEVPTVANRILLADALSAADMTAVRNAAGQAFRGIVTEDLLPCAADAGEVTTMLQNLRGILHGQGNMAHIITMWHEPLDEYEKRPDGSIGRIGEERAFRIPGFLWLRPSEWRALIGPGDVILNAETGEQVP